MVGAHGGWTSAEQVGSIGVFLLLLAFALHVWGRLGRNSLPYIGMNVIGAGLACWASWEIRFLPFVVLEGAWFLVATVELGRELFGRVSTA
ncbi:MAG: hypothetical protein MI919_40025 [Holophagales bacterium]|nr:hypothetical protein [Holophagales bacterium]